MSSVQCVATPPKFSKGNPRSPNFRPDQAELWNSDSEERHEKEIKEAVRRVSLSITAKERKEGARSLLRMQSWTENPDKEEANKRGAEKSAKEIQNTKRMPLKSSLYDHIEDSSGQSTVSYVTTSTEPSTPVRRNRTVSFAEETSRKPTLKLYLKEGLGAEFLTRLRDDLSITDGDDLLHASDKEIEEIAQNLGLNFGERLKLRKALKKKRDQDWLEGAGDYMAEDAALAELLSTDSVEPVFMEKEDELETITKRLVSQMSNLHKDMELDATMSLEDLEQQTEKTAQMLQTLNDLSNIEPLESRKQSLGDMDSSSQFASKGNLDFDEMTDSDTSQI